MENDKKIENLFTHGQKYRFTSDKQPSSEAKKAGHVKARERKNLKRDMFHLMFNKPLGLEGKDTLEEMVKLLLGGMFGTNEKTKLSYKSRVELALKIADFLGIKETLNQHMFGDSEEITGIDIQFIKSDQKKPKKDDYMTDKQRIKANNAVSAVMKSLSLGGELKGSASCDLENTKKDCK